MTKTSDERKEVEMKLEWQDKPLSDNERLKRESKFLRGTIVEDLENPLTGGFTGDNFQLIRFHGMYEQDDRDIRAERLEEKLEPLKFMLLRCRLPGGIIKPAQWIEIDKFAREHTYYQSIRLTNRQTFQYHGVPKGKLQSMHRLLHRIGLDSIATASDMNRNVLCTSNPIESELHQQAYEFAKKISEHLLPRSRGYLDVWIDGKKVESSDDILQESEPILGETYLPRKFKTAVAIPPLNDVDVYGNDMNFIAIQDDNGQLCGFNVLVGGGLSFEHGNTKTYPDVSKELGFVTLDKTLAAAEAIVTTQRDFGNRHDRKNARTRYTLQNMTLEGFRQEVEKRMGCAFEPIRPFEFTERGDRIGWVKGIDNKWHLTLFIESGRLTDKEDKPLLTGMLEIAKVHKGDFRITANQNMIVANVAEEDKEHIEQLARKYRLIRNDVSKQRENAMSCVALPTCPLAMAESERILPDFITEMDKILAKYGIPDDYIITRITGCPNGCGRSMLAEIGLVGKAVGRYNLHIGGDRAGVRIPRLYKENITIPEILAELDMLIGRWVSERNEEEAFGDFVIRQKIVRPVFNAAVDFWDNQ
ncbi:assimilatory sulfite reductase (NADPH) hemoprotein subunit [Pelistega sp. NLN82]|uniref:Sulfite reductase [NADPH] hemoprotein beta-component n=2 Tax=Pelistega ratti TaxID=2652177 RepID=A0A6L9Y7X4_9BURK|nr:assimilatory sulfite reductase (NADPH) hemoprotein subunit [Pelistega ratti]NEN75908.1 assimilatory sulfite reductase (NADPH) hemoprotein subunit [Pelistega ratti]